ncbi:MAG: hypothetical protein ACJ74Z_13590 [Bryobacteraceae bacterium]
MRTTKVYLMGDMAYLGFVATRKRQQEKGMQMLSPGMRSLLRARVELSGKSILHSTPAGLPLYRRLGSSAVADFGLYLGGCE